MSSVSNLPSIWRLAWMLFMQPLLLYRNSIKLGLDVNQPGLFILSDVDRYRSYLLRLLGASFLIMGLCQLTALGIDAYIKPSANLTKSIVDYFYILLFSLIMAIFISFGRIAVFFVAISVAPIIIPGDKIITNPLQLVIFGAFIGTGCSMMLELKNKEIIAVGSIVSGTVIRYTMELYKLSDIYIVLCFLSSFFIALFRINLYVFEYAISAILFYMDKKFCFQTLRKQSVFYHESCFLCIPWLERHIIHAAASHPADVVDALNACARSRGQRGIYRRATARLAAQTLESSARSGQFAPVMTLQGQWLPTVESASPGILAFRDIARFIEAARLASTAHQRQKYLNDAQLELSRLPLVLAEESKERRAAFAPLQPIWQEKLDELRAQAEAEAANSVPNPFLTQPLSTASGVEVFVGRDDLIRTLDAILADPQQRNSLALLGPRRCGKSSLLRMLPLKLPDAVPVFFDLQDNPAGTPAQFFSAIASRAAEQARRERDLVLPKLAPNPDITAFAQWLEQVDAALGSRRLLLCIDEFERLPDLFPGDHRALLQLMGLFRATVQNRRNIRLLVAGVAPFDELDAIWSDHFINLRELRVEHLDPDSAMRLLTRPIPGFNAIPEAVAREVITRTGCQPLLLQLYGSMLVDRLNAEQRTEATPEDLAAVDRDVREEGNAVNHFRNIFDSAPDDARAVLLALSAPNAPTPKMSSATRRYLLRRCFITPEGVPRIPVFFDWVQAEHG